MRVLRSLVTVCILLCLCLPHVQASTGAGVGNTAQIPLPDGRELADDELLAVEGELGPVLVFLIYVGVTAIAGAGVATIKENWFDEDYGIDGDDWPQIGYGAIAGAIFGGSGGMIHYLAK